MQKLIYTSVTKTFSIDTNMPPQRHLLNYLKEGWRSIKQANKEELFEKGKINKYPLQKTMQYYLNDWRLLRRTSEFHNFITSKHIHTMTKKQTT